VKGYYSVPNSNVRLKDGMVVMLLRFPGTKWVVHNGAYTYNGRNYFGWYFSAIPSQTKMPVNPHDLIGITIVSDGDSYPEPYPNPNPGMYPPPCPDDRWGPNPYPPMPPAPDGHGPFHFGRAEFEMLNSAFITVENVRKFEQLDTRVMPDGRIVCINSDNGERKYFRWNERDDCWDEIDPAAIIIEEVTKILVDYYNKDDIDAKVDNINSSIDEIDESIDEVSGEVERVDTKIDTIKAELDETISEISEKEITDVANLINSLNILQESLTELRTYTDSRFEDVDEEIGNIGERLDVIEDAVFRVKKLSELLETNTVLVSDDGKIKDSGYSIGDSSIDEIPEYSNETTLATEKAVADLVDRSQPKWTQF